MNSIQTFNHTDISPASTYFSQSCDQVVATVSDLASRITADHVYYGYMTFLSGMVTGIFYDVVRQKEYAPNETPLAVKCMGLIWSVSAALGMATQFYLADQNPNN